MHSGVAGGHPSSSPNSRPPEVPLAFCPARPTRLPFRSRVQKCFTTPAEIAEAAEEWTRSADDSLRDLAMTRAHGMEVTLLVNGFAEELGRPVHPFRLDVELVPTAERGIWWIGQHTIAVSAELRSDPDAYVAALRPIVAMLA